MTFSRSRRLTATVPLPPREVERRINAEALLGGTQYPVTGWARFGHVRLRRTRFSSWNGEFRLAGRIESAGAGSLLKLDYGRSPLGCITAVLYYVPLLLMTLALSVGNWSPGVGLGTKISTGLFFAAFWLLPALLVWLGGRRREQELEILIDFLEREIGATVVSGPLDQSSSSSGRSAQAE